ncbi:synaptic vesicle membrane protein VAT-1 homolog-like [Dromiciops gliroides]|uniref:synaptic vesicle membrane protein VAT-1 homolog-like n=1 Tax=Dromiciops gliroides TaxID=33562 RepID=UPI001CC69D88|nr:synaptic vesicle membrane protein VAT-1 homolog-like [Dromiciops gliroides]
MAKEGAEKAEETEQMIAKEGGPEAAQGGGGGGGSPRAGDTKEMRAVLLAGFGGLSKLRVSRRPMPEPQEAELKIRVKACGLNFIDLMVRQGNIDNPPKTPLVPGFECSGIVEAIGDNVKGYEIGDRVMAFVNYNAWAEVVCTPAEFVYRIPDDMNFPEAAAFPMNFVTAYMMLFEVANLREGMSVLVHSAGGGVGQAVAQLCSTIPNVTVFGTASSFKHEAIKDSVTHLFDRNADYVQEVKRISPEGVDIVLDCLCGENTGKGLSLLKPLGTYILYGSSNTVTGETKSFFSFAKSWWQVEKVNPIKLYEENKVIAGFSLLNLLFKQGRGGLIKGIMDKLIALYNEKKIKPTVDSLWALEEVKEAMQRIHDRGNIGKLILDVGKGPYSLG